MWIEKSRDQLLTSGKTDIWAFENKKNDVQGSFFDSYCVEMDVKAIEMD